MLAGNAALAGDATKSPVVTTASAARNSPDDVIVARHFDTLIGLYNSKPPTGFNTGKWYTFVSSSLTFSESLRHDGNSQDYLSETYL